MTPPSSSTRLALYAAIVFTLAFGVGAAGASLLEGDPPAPVAEAMLDPDVAVAMVPIPGGPLLREGRKDLQTVATSVVAVPLLTQMLRSADGLTARQVREGDAALTNPGDPRATDRLGSDLDDVIKDPAAARAAVKTLAGAGATKPGGQPYRELEWPAEEEAKFLARLAGGCLLGPKDTKHVMSQLQTAGSSLRWGLGATGASDTFTGASERAGAVWITRQAGIVRRGSESFAVAIVAATPTRDAGEAAVSRAAAWVTRSAKPQVTGTGGCP